MAQSVWHKHDIENILRGVELTCQHMAAQFDGPESDSYRRGFLTALAATATSFGIQVDAALPASSLNALQASTRRLCELAQSSEQD